jgi:hypothetical protein
VNDNVRERARQTVWSLNNDHEGGVREELATLYNCHSLLNFFQIRVIGVEGMLIATNSPSCLFCFTSKHKGLEMEQDLALALRQRALSALEVSTTMLTVAQNLLKQGNQREAVRLRNEARYKRNESILLMDQARDADLHAANILKFPDRKTSEAPPEGRLASPAGGRRNLRTG